MAGFGYGGFGSPYGGFGGGNMQQTFEQERMGYGPQGFGIYEQEQQINRNPYTGATTVVQENEFIPAGRGGYGGVGGVGGYGGYGGVGGYGGYGGYGGGYGNRFF